MTEQAEHTETKDGKYDDSKTEGARASVRGKRRIVPSINYTSDDPIKMYLRDMESLTLLTKQDEVIIAQRIESGKEKIEEIIFKAPFVVEEIINLSRLLKDKHVSISNICFIEKFGISGSGSETTGTGKATKSSNQRGNTSVRYRDVSEADKTNIINIFLRTVKSLNYHSRRRHSYIQQLTGNKSAGIDRGKINRRLAESNTKIAGKISSLNLKDKVIEDYLFHFKSMAVAVWQRPPNRIYFPATHKRGHGSAAPRHPSIAPAAGRLRGLATGRRECCVIALRAAQAARALAPHSE